MNKFLKLKKLFKSEAGISLMEVMVIMFTFGIISLAVANSAMVSLRTYNFVRLRSAADGLALSKMEQFAALNPENILEEDGAEELNLYSPSAPAVAFKRTSEIEINPDLSRTITITVQSQDVGDSRINTSFTSTYSLWSYGT